MKTNINNIDNQNLLKKFAIKSKKKQIHYTDKAVIYNRCSTEKQDSLEWQEKVCTNYCKQNEFNLIRCFGEKVSATTDNREQFQKMLTFCDKEHISHIVIFSYDRFSRTGDLSLLKKLRKKGVKVHAATQSVDDQTPSGRFSQSMYMMFAEMENEQRAEKVIEGMKNKLRKGEWIGKPPIGYKKRYVNGEKEHDHDKRQCFIDKKGELLQQAFHWKDTEKISNVEVIKRLKEMGLSLVLPQLTRIFRNPFYCGYVTSSLLDGELIPGKHEPLITEDVFLRVNGIVNSRAYGWNVIREHEDMPLKASVICSECGRPITGYIKKEKYIYYRCPNGRCGVNIRNIKLHEMFKAEVSKLSINTCLIPAIKSQLEATYWALNKRDTTREKPMKDELTRLKKELETMEFNLAIGNVTPEIYNKHSFAHKQKIQEIEEELEMLIIDSVNLSSYLDSAIQNAGNLFNMWQLLDYKGKVRFQKLIYPNGLVFQPEIPAVGPLEVNPIFSAITSISSTLEASVEYESSLDKPELYSVYSMFPSWTFFWEKLEQTALVFKDFPSHVVAPAYTASSTGDTISYFSSGDTNQSDMTTNDLSWIVPGIGGMTGDTIDGRIISGR